MLKKIALAMVHPELFTKKELEKLMKIKSWNAIMGVQSYVMEAELAQEKAEYAEQQEFKAWKEKRKKYE